MKGTITDTERSWIKRHTASNGEEWVIDLGGSYDTCGHHDDYDGTPSEPGYPADQRIVRCHYNATPDQIAKAIEEWIEENQPEEEN